MNLQPSPKDPQIDDLLTSLMGKDRRAVIQQALCMTCDVGLTCRTCNQPLAKHTATHTFIPFRDPLSYKEYSISGMCQSCQDKVFTAEPDEGDFL